MFESKGVKNLKSILSYCFSNTDIKRYLGEDTKIIEYQELRNYENIDAVLPEERDFVVILIETKQNSGHWTALLKYDGLLEWFDSYGMDVDKELSFIPESIRRMLGQGKKRLTELIDESDYDYIYNDTKLQSQKSFDNTCGRWVCSRVLHFKKNKNLKEYINYFNIMTEERGYKGVLKYDMVVINEINYSGQN